MFYDKFQKERTQALCEQDVGHNLLPVIEEPGFAEGVSSADEWHRGLRFDHFAPFIDQALVEPRPDRAYGPSAQTLKRKIREDLADLIRLSNRTRCITLPNFSIEVKGPDGKGKVAEQQACYNAAFGPRAMHSLRAYGKRDASAAFDGKAYTTSMTFESNSSALNLHEGHEGQAARLNM
ncbi:hypothetical protein BJY01DRAFT_251599 [Aspergillus pseudoustus]|uniref:DUF7924 domain-containing protein n=1 Tax=Aspergillus pseudoustus TaxID=1810923 RepID=A0ABR4JAY2_9EURO